LFGQHIAGKGGEAATVSRPSRREEWGKEKGACMQAIDF